MENKIDINCENIYTSCSCNCYPHCLDILGNLIIFGTENSIAIYDIEVS